MGYLLIFFLLSMVSCQSLFGKGAGSSSSVNQASESGKPCQEDDGSVVVLVYRQFDSANKYVSIKSRQFIQQMEFFKENGYEVVNLNQVVQALQDKKPFGKKWVVITMDGSHRSIYTKAKSVLEQYKYPYTVFVNTSVMEPASSQFMEWEELREIVKSGLGHLGSHAHTQKYLLREMNEEERKKDILSSVEKIYENTGKVPSYFSYPFGEFSNHFMDEIKSMTSVIAGKDFQFKAAFTRTAGPVGCSSNLYALPRFMMNQVYGVVDDSFKIKINSRHLPVFSEYPNNSAICASSKVNKLYFSTFDQINLEGIRCYSGGYKPRVQVLKGLISVQLNRPLGNVSSQGSLSLSGRMNCIAQTTEKGVFYWHGYSWRIFKDSKMCFSQ